MKVVSLSGGVSSYIAGWLVKDTVDKWLYIDIDDQHSDTLRFVNECAQKTPFALEILKSRYGSVSNICRSLRFIRRGMYACCTDYLKKEYARNGNMA